MDCVPHQASWNHTKSLNVTRAPTNSDCRISGSRARRPRNKVAGQILGWPEKCLGGWTKVSIKDASGAQEGIKE